MYYLEVKVLKISDEPPKDLRQEKNELFDQVFDERKSLLKSVVNTFIGAEVKERKTFI
jgi:hypothetical protein